MKKEKQQEWTVQVKLYLLSVFTRKNLKTILFVSIILIAILPVFYLEAGVKIPTSSRAQEAIDRVAPSLKKDLKKNNLEYGAPIYIRIFKIEKELELWVNKDNRFRLFKTYPVCTYGNNGLGPKLKQGDGKAPEGFYFVSASSLNPVSNFHLSFNLGYPNKYDRAHQRTGSALMVHGGCVSIGCYAMTNKNIEEIYAFSDAALRNKQSFFRVHIFPFKMSRENMKLYRKSKWYSFWKNLKEGYDFFQMNNYIPPNVDLKDLRYIFNHPSAI